VKLKSRIGERKRKKSSSPSASFGTSPSTELGTSRVSLDFAGDKQIPASPLFNEGPVFDGNAPFGFVHGRPEGFATQLNLDRKIEALMIETLDRLLAALWWNQLSDGQKDQIGHIIKEFS
jgi:hypothetical protein